MPVLIPYTSRFSSTARSTTACAVRTASQAAGSRAIRDPGSDSRRVSAIVSRPRPQYERLVAHVSSHPVPLPLWPVFDTCPCISGRNRR